MKDQAEAGTLQQPPPKQVAAPKGQAVATKTPWFCVRCGATNPDDHLKKCHACKNARIKQDDDAAATEDKTALSPGTVRLMQETAPEKLDEEAVKDEVELNGLRDLVKNCAQWSEHSICQRTIEEQAKKRIAELGEKMKKSQSPDNKVVKSIMGDKSREKNNYDGKRRQIEADLKKASDAKETIQNKVKEDMKEAEKAYEEKKKYSKTV